MMRLRPAGSPASAHCVNSASAQLSKVGRCTAGKAYCEPGVGRVNGRVGVDFRVTNWRARSLLTVLRTVMSS
jgi:hypothetical protein